jgi:choice-of-anchor A domain-containing protein
MDLKFYAKPAITQMFSLKRIALFLLSVVMYTGIASAQPYNGIALDGTNDRVSVSSAAALNISSSITIEAWIKYTRTAGTQNVVSKSSGTVNNSYIFPRTQNGWETVQFLVNLNVFGWQVLEVPFSGSTHNYFDQWHHLAATFDGLIMRIYIDGVLAGTKSAVGSITVNSNPLWIGGQSGTNEYFRGKVDDVRLWDRALNQCEIASNKNCGLTGNEAGLAAYYKFDQGVADGINPLQLTVFDATPNHNNGQINLSLTGLITSNWTTGIVSGECTPFTPVEATIGSVESSIIAGSDIHLLSSGGDSYQWAGPNGFTSTDQNPVITNASSLNSGTYTVVVTKNGCSVTLSILILVTDWAKALYFDGQNDMVSIPNSSSLNFTNKLTVETWIHPTSPSPMVQNVVCKATEADNSGYIFPRTDDGWQSFSFWLKINNQWQIITAPFNRFNQWTHVAATYDGLFMKIFLNGIEVASLAAPGTITQNTNALSIGQQPSAFLNEYYKGGVDELRLWNRTLSQCEIMNNMNCQLNGANNGLANQSDLSAYYRFNQGLLGANNSSVTTLIDSSGHSNNGTLLNFALTGTTSNWAAGGAVNNATCTPYTATLPTITSNGPIIEVGQTIEMTASEGTSWSWTGPLGFTSNQQTVTIPNSTTNRSGVYTVNISGNGCTSTVNAKIKVTYKAGTLHFDGVNDQVVVPNSASLNINKTITLESWIKPTNSSRLIQSVASKSTRTVNNGYIFPRTDDGWQTLSFYLHVNGVWEKVFVPYPAINEWHHVSATYDGYYMRVYIDGVLKGSKLIASGGNITVNTNDLMIGQQGGYTLPGSEEYFQGDLEELRIWNRSLSQCEIINNMNCEVGELQNNGLAAYYKFNQGYVDADNTAITTLIDATPNANNGTLEQFTLDGLTSNWSTAKVSGTCITYAQPPVAANANGTVFAPGSIIRLFGTGGVTYTWDGPDNFASTDNSPVINNAQFPNTGVYTVTAPFVNCVITASVRLVVSNLPPLATSGPTTICPSGSVEISTNSIGTAYQWFHDNVAIPNATNNSYTATESGSYTVSVTTATDVIVSTAVTVTVTDNAAPVPVVASLPTLHLQTPATVTDVPTALDDCAGTVNGTTQDPLYFELPGTYNITWTYDDGNGNISTQTQSVEVVWSPDVVAPQLTVPANITSSNDNGICGAVVNFAATATDNRPGTVTITYSQDPGTVFAVGTTIVTVTATDEAGNIATGDFTVTVNDTEVPVLTLPANVNATSSTGITVGAATATDNCGTAVVSHSTIPASFPLGITNITWTATDAAGNTVSGVQTVTVTDVTVPTLFGVPANATAPCGVIPAVAVVTASDDFDTNPVVTMTETTNGNIITRTWTATDASGNTSSATQTITVIPDTQAPVITAPANVSSTSGTGINIGTATATDNCSTPSVSHSTLPASFPLGVTNITWTAVDAAGNTVTAIQTVTVSDVAAPVLAGVPADATAPCGVIPAATTVTATDNFDTNPVVTMTETTNGNIITRTWTATDASGNTASATQTITVIPDTQAPVMTAPANVNATSGTGINIGTATATDNCSTPTVSHSILPASFPLGVTNVTWTAVDAAGNTTTGIQTVTVSDVAAPVLSGVPASTTATCGIIPAAAVVTATDNFDTNPVVTMTETTNGNIITRTWTATDASGNTSTATQTITVVPDTQAPVLTAPANVNATSSTGITVGTATATDNCGTATVTHSTIPASFPLGVTNIIWTATDASGNTATHTQTVTVTDVTAPALSGVPANTTAQCGVIPAAPAVTATDNFDANPVVTMTEVANGNTITRTWTATDASGNSSSATQVITVSSTAAPIITGPTSGTVVTQNPVAGALEFNVFAQNTVTFGNAQSHGPVALGGDLTLSGGYSVSNNSVGTFKVSNVPVTLLMGGKVNYSGGNGINVNQNGYVKIGNNTGSYVWYTDQNNAYSPIRITPGSNYNGSPRINLQANAQNLGVSATNNPVFQAGLIDFAAAFTQLKANAASLGSMTDNANLTNANGGTIPHTNMPTQVKINLATGVNVLNINASDLNYVQNFTYNNQPDASHILVINVNAPGTFNWNVWNSGGIGDQNGKYIIYNFYNTTALTVQGNGSVMGTLFAPYATINKTSSQNISGQIIGQSFVHTSGTNTYYKFEGTITSGSTTVIAQNSNNPRTTNNANCSYTVNGNEFNITATPGDNCGSGVVTMSYTLTGATTGTGSNLAGVTLNPGTTTVTWTATSGSSVSTYTFNVTVQAAIPAAPSVNAVNNCGSTTLNATGSNLLWSNNATGSSITVNTPGNYTVTQTVNGCTSAPATITAAPNAIPAAPSVNAVNNCGSTTLNATGSNLQWSNNATGSSITVNTPGDYTVTQTVNGCTSAPASVTAAPKAIPAAPVVNAVNNCGSTTLNATGTDLKWSNNATGSSIIVTANGIYSVTNTVNGCTSAATETQVTISTYPSVAQIAGNTTVTAGSTTQLTNNTGSGTWNSNNNSIATVNASGLVSGVSAGSAVISYTVTTTAGCTTVVTANVTVNPNCSVPVITAANVVANTAANSTNCTSPVTYAASITATPAAAVTYTLSGATTGSGTGTGSGVVFNTGVTTVVVNAANSCGAASATLTVTCSQCNCITYYNGSVFSKPGSCIQ